MTFISSFFKAMNCCHTSPPVKAIPTENSQKPNGLDKVVQPPQTSHKVDQSNFVSDVQPEVNQKPHKLDEVALHLNALVATSPTEKPKEGETGVTGSQLATIARTASSQSQKTVRTLIIITPELAGLSAKNALAFLGQAKLQPESIQALALAVESGEVPLKENLNKLIGYKVVIEEVFDKKESKIQPVKIAIVPPTGTKLTDAFPVKAITFNSDATFKIEYHETHKSLPESELASAKNEIAVVANKPLSKKRLSVREQKIAKEEKIKQKKEEKKERKRAFEELQKKGSEPAVVQKIAKGLKEEAAISANYREENKALPESELASAKNEIAVVTNKPQSKKRLSVYEQKIAKKAKKRALKKLQKQGSEPKPTVEQEAVEISKKEGKPLNKPPTAEDQSAITPVAREQHQNAYAAVNFTPHGTPTTESDETHKSLPTSTLEKEKDVTPEKTSLLSGIVNAARLPRGALRNKTVGVVLGGASSLALAIKNMPAIGTGLTAGALQAVNMSQYPGMDIGVALGLPHNWTVMSLAEGVGNQLVPNDPYAVQMGLIATGAVVVTLATGTLYSWWTRARQIKTTGSQVEEV